MVVAPAAGVNIDDSWVGVGGLLIERRASGDEEQFGVGRTAEADENPYRRQAVQVGGQMAHDGRRLLHRSCARFPYSPSGRASPDRIRRAAYTNRAAGRRH